MLPVHRLVQYSMRTIPERYSRSYHRVSRLHHFNSQFVSGISSIKPPCAAASVPTVSAPNYFYLCNTAYDSLTNQMEFAPCLSVTGDPVVGSTSNISTGTCPGSGGKLSAIG